MIILGINAYHADASACLVIDGQLVAAAEEERFRRVKHWAGFPRDAIKYCLREAKLEVKDLDHIAINRDPKANLLKKVLFTFGKGPSLGAVRDRLKNASKVWDIKEVMSKELGVRSEEIRAKVQHIEHHKAHLGSTFYVSPFESAAVASVDGFGDFVSTMIGLGQGTKVTVFDRVTFPHSLGLFYLAMTQYLGFTTYGEEYKVMGLAAYGKPEYLHAMRTIVRLKPQGRFALDLDYFLHHSEGVSMTWDDGAPVIGPVFSDKLVKRLGPPRCREEAVKERHENLAASLQTMYEEAVFHVLNDLYDRTHEKNLCLAGGCALNSVANGQILLRTPFERVYIPPAAADAGGAIGAAYAVCHGELGYPRSFVMDRADWGPEFGVAELREALGARREELEKLRCGVLETSDYEELCRRSAEEIAKGKIVGWFQGRMEWGARALGQRSIVADPRRSEMKAILNARIKRREPFRPFAPSILEEAVGEYFEQTEPAPFMTMTYRVKAEKRDLIPAPTHVDGTGRLQTVSRTTQPLYWRLIKEFEKLTGIPVVLNTSFNENEPIVCTPQEALDCFLRTKMDVLAIGPFLITRTVD